MRAGTAGLLVEPEVPDVIEGELVIIWEVVNSELPEEFSGVEGREAMAAGATGRTLKSVTADNL